MRVAYLDCGGGVSGDMFLGALLDAGWPEERLRHAVAWLKPEVGELRVESRMRQGFRGLGLVVQPAAEHDHHHRGLTEVLALLAQSPLPPAVRGKAEEVFRRLAEAEGRAHGRPAAEVHFHEVGAVDALIDVVGTASALTEMGIEALYFSPLPLGSGLVPSAHGAIPLPAPATAHLVQGIHVAFTGLDGERTTPTGAALVTALGRCMPPPPMFLERVGTGAGSYSYPDRPNIARVFIGRTAGVPSPEGVAEDPQIFGGSGAALAFSDLPLWGWGGDREERREACPGFWTRTAILETQIDDASSEEIALLCEELRKAGALEVMAGPVQMKKARIGFRLAVVCRPDREESLAAHLLLHSTTLGVRRRLEWRRELERRSLEVPTCFGSIEVKEARRGERWIGQPEYEAVRRAALEHGVPFRDVYRAALAALGTGPGRVGGVGGPAEADPGAGG
ncbi:MAG: nickel pincer cofactor biosynthesis protein LarC [Candidatus Eisenbacteria bacterium]